MEAATKDMPWSEAQPLWNATSERFAAGDGMKGGLPEYIIPNWLENGSVMIRRVSGVNPEF